MNFKKQILLILLFSLIFSNAFLQAQCEEKDYQCFLDESLLKVEEGDILGARKSIEKAKDEFGDISEEAIKKTISSVKEKIYSFYSTYYSYWRDIEQNLEENKFLMAMEDLKDLQSLSGEDIAKQFAYTEKLDKDLSDRIQLKLEELEKNRIDWVINKQEKGDELFEAKSYKEAENTYELAKRESLEEEMKKYQLIPKIRDCRYLRLLGEGEVAIDDANCKAALPLFKEARIYISNKQVIDTKIEKTTKCVHTQLLKKGLSMLSNGDCKSAIPIFEEAKAYTDQLDELEKNIEEARACHYSQLLENAANSTIEKDFDKAIAAYEEAKEYGDVSKADEYILSTKDKAALYQLTLAETAFQAEQYKEVEAAIKIAKEYNASIKNTNGETTAKIYQRYAQDLMEISEQKYQLGKHKEVIAALKNASKWGAKEVNANGETIAKIKARYAIAMTDQADQYYLESKYKQAIDSYNIVSSYAKVKGVKDRLDVVTYLEQSEKLQQEGINNLEALGKYNDLWNNINVAYEKAQGVLPKKKDVDISSYAQKVKATYETISFVKEKYQSNKTEAEERLKSIDLDLPVVDVWKEKVLAIEADKNANPKTEKEIEEKAKKQVDQTPDQEIASKVEKKVALLPINNNPVELIAKLSAGNGEIDGTICITSIVSFRINPSEPSILQRKIYFKLRECDNTSATACEGCNDVYEKETDYEDAYRIPEALIEDYVINEFPTSIEIEADKKYPDMGKSQVMNESFDVGIQEIKYSSKSNIPKMMAIPTSIEVTLKDR